VSPDNAIERILEQSAEAQMKRREAAENSQTFHKLSGAITAYGKALALLKLFNSEEFYTTIVLSTH